MAEHTLSIEYQGFPEPKDKHKSIPVGHVLSLRGTFKVAGTLTNPTGQTLTIEEPDGTDNTPTPSSVSTGVYDGSFTPDQTGWHRVTWVSTGAVAQTSTSEFYVHTTGIT